MENHLINQLSELRLNELFSDMDSYITKFLFYENKEESIYGNDRKSYDINIIKKLLSEFEINNKSEEEIINFVNKTWRYDNATKVKEQIQFIGKLNENEKFRKLQSKFLKIEIESRWFKKIKQELNPKRIELIQKAKEFLKNFHYFFNH